MRLLCLTAVTVVAFAGCGSSGGGAGGGSSATGGQAAQGGHAGKGGAAGAPASGGSGTGGAIAGSGGAGGHGGAVSASGGGGHGGGGSTGSGGVSGSGGAGGADGGTVGSGGGGGAGGRPGSGGAGGSAGTVCGGLLAHVCDADQWCDFGGTCGAGDQTGVCQPRQVGGILCAPAPVCGCDGKTYPTACNAHQAGTDTMATNACIPGNGGAGAPCAADTDCASGFKCCNTNGSVASAIACRQVAAGSQCPALP